MLKVKECETSSAVERNKLKGFRSGKFLSSGDHLTRHGGVEAVKQKAYMWVVSVVADGSKTCGIGQTR